MQVSRKQIWRQILKNMRNKVCSVASTNNNLNTTATQIEYACVRHRLPQVDGNEYEAKNNEPREISESGTKKPGAYTDCTAQDFCAGQQNQKNSRSIR